MNRLKFKNLWQLADQSNDLVAPFEVEKFYCPMAKDFREEVGRAICFADATNAPVVVETAYGGLCVNPGETMEYVMQLFADVQELANRLDDERCKGV